MRQSICCLFFRGHADNRELARCLSVSVQTVMCLRRGPQIYMQYALVMDVCVGLVQFTIVKTSLSKYTFGRLVVHLSIYASRLGGVVLVNLEASTA